MRKIIVIVIGMIMALAATVATGSATETGSNEPTKATASWPMELTRPLMPCPDDGTEFGPCYWDADTQGNGDGTSFLLDSHGNRYPIP